MEKGKRSKQNTMDVRVALSPLTFALMCIHPAGSNNRRSEMIWPMTARFQPA